MIFGGKSAITFQIFNGCFVFDIEKMVVKERGSLVNPCSFMNTPLVFNNNMYAFGNDIYVHKYNIPQQEWSVILKTVQWWVWMIMFWCITDSIFSCYTKLKIYDRPKNTTWYNIRHILSSYNTTVYIYRIVIKAMVSSLIHTLEKKYSLWFKYSTCMTKP